jgi:hypothetical protein
MLSPIAESRILRFTCDRDFISRNLNIYGRHRYPVGAESRVLQLSLGFVDSMLVEVVL